MYVDNKFLKWDIIRKMSGNHYLFLLSLIMVKSPLKRKDIEVLLTDSNTQRCSMTDNTLRKVISDLLDKGFILYDKFNKEYSVNFKTYNPEYTKISSFALQKAVNKQISSADFRIYICLMKLLSKGREVTYEQIAMNLGISSGNIGKSIHRLENEKLLTIEKRVSKRGMYYNVYTPWFPEE